MSVCTSSMENIRIRSLLLHVRDDKLEQRTAKSWGISATHCCSERANNSAIIHPSKRIGISRMTSHTRHSSEPILGRNNFPLGYLYLWHIDSILVLRRHKKWPCTGDRVNAILSELLHVLDASLEPRTPQFQRHYSHALLCRVCLQLEHHPTVKTD